MPRMTGIEATEYIRRGRCGDALQVTDTIPWIIAVTAINDREACLASGMNDFMSKPLDPKIIKNALRTFAESRLTSFTLPQQKQRPSTATPSSSSSTPTSSSSSSASSASSMTALPATTPRNNNSNSSNVFSFTAPAAVNALGVSPANASLSILSSTTTGTTTTAVVAPMTPAPSTGGGLLSSRRLTMNTPNSGNLTPAPGTVINRSAAFAAALQQQQQQNSSNGQQ
jgi:CheY-like chemotaxis protein